MKKSFVCVWIALMIGLFASLLPGTPSDGVFQLLSVSNDRNGLALFLQNLDPDSDLSRLVGFLIALTPSCHHKGLHFYFQL